MAQGGNRELRGGLGLEGLSLRDGAQGQPAATASGASKKTPTPPGAYLDPDGELQRLLGPGHEVVRVHREERASEAVSTSAAASATASAATSPGEEASSGSSGSSGSSVLMVNGRPVGLEGEEGRRIRECLLRGVMPEQDLVNHLLAKAGLILKPHLSHLVTTDMQVTKVTTTSKSVSVSGGAGSPERVNSRQVESSTSSSSRTRLVNGLSPPPKSSSPSSSSPTKEPSFSLPKSSSSSSFLESLSSVLSSGKIASDKEEEESDFSLLLWSRCHLRPPDLLSHLLGEGEGRGSPSYSKQRLARFVRRWVRWFPGDFSQNAAMQDLRTLCRRLQQQQVDPHLLATLSKHLEALDRHVPFLEEHQQDEADCASLEGASSLSLPPPPSLLSLCPVELARELTRIELDYLANLGPEEIVHSLSKGKEDKNTRNIDAYTEWFNHLSHLVATTVVSSPPKSHQHPDHHLQGGEPPQPSGHHHHVHSAAAAVKEGVGGVAVSLRRRRQLRRGVRSVRQWIEVARQCCNLGNFNSLMAVITGLNMAPVTRLAKTWEAVRSEKFAVLEHQMDPSSNFSSYRSTLTAAIARSEAATDDRARAVVPFFSLFYKDLFVAREKFLRDGAPFDLAGASEVSAPVREFAERNSEANCPYRRSERAAAFLRSHPVVRSEELLDLGSYTREPPRNGFEKRRYKELKKLHKGGGGGKDQG